MSTAWPFLGRRQELQHMLRTIGDDRRSGLVLMGDAGVGKTRLARRGLSDAEAAGWATAWVSGMGATTAIPLGPFAQLLRRSSEAKGDRFELIHRLCRSLARRAGGRRLLLGVDDAHLLDPASAALVYELALTGVAFVIVVARTGEPVPAPVAALWTEELAERLDVGPLSRSEVEELVLTVLGPADDSTLLRLWVTSGGNALWLRELILGGTASGALVKEVGIWRWLGRFVVSPHLVEIVSERLGTLDPAERAALEVLALAEPLGASLLERLVEPSVIDAVERLGLVEATAEGHRTDVRLAHPLYGELLRSTIPPMASRAVHRRLAAALDATGARRRDDLLRLATWELEAGTTTSTVRLVAAARRALALFDHPLAERLARAARDHGGGFPADLTLAEALIGQRRGEDAEVVLAGLAEVAETDDEVASVALTRGSNLFWTLGHAVRAEDVLQSAAACVQVEAWRDELAALRAAFLFFYAPMPEVLDAVGPSLSRSGTADRTRVQCLLPALGASVFAGDLQRALDQIEVGMGLLARCGDELPLAETQFRIVKWCGLWLSGRLLEAHDLARHEYDLATQRKAYEVAAHWCMELGYSLLLTGKIGAAVHQLQEATLLLRDHDRWDFIHCNFSFLAEAAALRGDIRTAESAWKQAQSLRPAFVRQLDGILGLAPAWIAWANGEHGLAVNLARKAAGISADLGQHAFEAVGLFDVARLGRSAEVEARLAELAGLVDGALVSAFAAHASASAAGNGPQLDEVATRWEALGAVLYAAEAAAEAALAHRAAGLRARCQSSRARADALAARCEGATTPALLLLGGTPDYLTAREREIATMAARGLASREIARRLVLSPRTVDNHLTRAYAKLGVTGRAGLPVALGLLSSEPSRS